MLFFLYTHLSIIFFIFFLTEKKTCLTQSFPSTMNSFFLHWNIISITNFKIFTQFLILTQLDIPGMREKNICALNISMHLKYAFIRYSRVYVSLAQLKNLHDCLMLRSSFGSLCQKSEQRPAKAGLFMNRNALLTEEFRDIKREYSFHLRSNLKNVFL